MLSHAWPIIVLGLILIFGTRIGRSILKAVLGTTPSPAPFIEAEPGDQEAAAFAAFSDLVESQVRAHVAQPGAMQSVRTAQASPRGVELPTHVPARRGRSAPHVREHAPTAVPVDAGASTILAPLARRTALHRLEASPPMAPLAATAPLAPRSPGRS